MRFLLLILLCLCVITGFGQSDPKADSLRRCIQQATTDSARVENLGFLVGHYANKGNATAVQTTLNEAFTYAKQMKDPFWQSYVHLLGVLSHRTLQDYPQALKHIEQGLALLPKQLSKLRLFTKVRLLANKGNILLYQGDYPHSLQAFTEALTLSRQMKKHTLEGEMLGNIFSIYLEMKDYEKALSYINQALVIFRRNKDVHNEALTLTNIGLVHFDLNRMDSARYYFHESERLCRKIGLESGLASALSGIGETYIKQEKYAEAVRYFEEGLAIDRKNNDPYGLCHSLGFLGQCYLHLRQYAKAKTALLEGLTYAREMNFLSELQDSYLLLSELGKKTGDFAFAYENHVLYTQYKDSLFSEEKSREIGRIETEHRLREEQEARLRKQQAEQARLQVETDRRNNLQYLTIFGAIIGLFIGLYLSGRFAIPVRVMDVALFVGVLLLFEFLLILFDPLLDQYTGGIPIQKLAFNTLIALAVAPLHRVLESRVRKRLLVTQEHKRKS